MAAMEYRLLGPLEVLEDGRPLALGGDRPRALLALLLLRRNQVVSSDALAEALWSGRSGGGAKALQVTVSRLRKALGPRAGAALATRPPGYRLEVEPGELDLDRFEALAAAGREALAEGDTAAAEAKLTEALGLHRGPPLADLAYEPFAQAEIARIEESRLAATEDLAAARLELGRHDGLIGELEGLVATHPLRERPRAQLMLALYRGGRQAEALDLYRATRALLVEELGIEPGRELKELEAAVLRQDPALDPTPPPVTAPRAPPPAPAGLVGRAAELAELDALLEGAAAGRGAVALIGGEPGVGKTRLADAAAARAAERGVAVFVGRCWEAGGAPSYWPWTQALRACVREAGEEAVRARLGEDAHALAAIVPELAPGEAVPAGTGADGARFRLFEAVAKLLADAARPRALMLGLDDLHAADADSLLLLRFLAGQLAALPVVVVGCYRDTDVVPGHPLAEALPDLAREPIVHRIELAGLDRAATARLLEQAAGRAPSDELAARVHEETAGNALFAGEVARLLAAEGALDAPGAGPLPIPAGVREAIGRRLQRLSEGARQGLTVAAAIGREFDLALLERATEMDEDELFADLEEAVAAQLVGDVPGTIGRLRFSHVLVRDTLYEGLPATRRLRLHRAIAAHLEAMHAGSPDPPRSELAHHYLLAGAEVAEKAIEWSARAGEYASAQHGYEQAAHHYADALALLRRSGAAESVQCCELLLGLGDARSRGGASAEAQEAFGEAADLAERLHRPDLLATAAVGYGGRFVWGRASNVPRLVPLLERGLAAVGDADSPARVRLLARLASALRDEPTRERRVELSGLAVEIARRLDDPAALAYALDGRWAACEGPDYVEGHLHEADELIDLALGFGDRERAYIGHEYRMQAFWAQGDRAGVELELDVLRDLAAELRQPSQRWHLATADAVLALTDGRFADAERYSAEAAAIGGNSFELNTTGTRRLQQFVFARAVGGLEELEGPLRQAAHRNPVLIRFRCALADLLAELGRAEEARAELDALMPLVLAGAHVDAEWLFAMNVLAGPCAAVGDEEMARGLYDLLAPWDRYLANAPCEATFGAVARGLGVLAAVTGRPEQAARHFETAIEVERRMGARPWLAHTQHAYAELLYAEGEPERAGDLAGAARTTYTELGMDGWARRVPGIPVLNANEERR